MNLIGERVFLRPWLPDDTERMLDAFRGTMEWKRLDAPYFPAPTLEDARRLMSSLAEATDAVPRRRVIATRGDNHLIGVVSWYWESEATRWPGVGLVIYDPTNWGRGYGSEALTLWCDFLFRTLSVRRLDLRTWSGNVPMQKLALKLGFKEEARFRAARIVDGVYYDSLGYGILAEEWNARALRPRRRGGEQASELA